jgi:hypothetical protein
MVLDTKYCPESCSVAQPYLLTQYQKFLSNVGRIAVWLVTLPYYRFYHFNTMDPIMRLSKYTAEPDRFDSILLLLSRWRTRKTAELHFISIAVRQITFLFI